VPSPEFELWNNISAALMDQDIDRVDELIRDIPLGQALANLVSGALNNRLAFAEILHGTDPGVGAKSFQPTGGDNHGR
jgi:hypothetical protein